MQLSDLFDKISKDKVPFIIGGIVAGVLGFWVLTKLASPFVGPYIKDACRSYLGMETGGGMGKMEPANVEAANVELGTMTRRINAVGQLRANSEVTLRSEMAGRITGIKFKEGETVQKGDVLIQFEDADLLAELESAKAEAEFRQAQYGRFTKLRGTGVASGKEFDEAKSGYDMAKARADKAQAQLDKAKIVAPFSGTIGLIDVDEGAYVQAAQDLVKLVDNDPTYADFKIPEKYLHDISVGQLAEVLLDGFPNEKFIATVEAIDSSIEGQSHSIAVRAAIPNPDGRLRSGLYANISLIIGERANTLMIPESAVMRDGDREFVWSVEGGRVKRRMVITGTHEKAKVEIVNGLKDGMKVVTSGQLKLYEGYPVTLANQPKLEDYLKGANDTPESKAKATEKAEKKDESKDKADEAKPAEAPEKDKPAAEAATPANN